MKAFFSVIMQKKMPCVIYNSYIIYIINSQRSLLFLRTDVISYCKLYCLTITCLASVTYVCPKYLITTFRDQDTQYVHIC